MESIKESSCSTHLIHGKRHHKWGILFHQEAVSVFIYDSHWIIVWACVHSHKSTFQCYFEIMGQPFNWASLFLSFFEFSLGKCRDLLYYAFVYSNVLLERFWFVNQFIKKTQVRHDTLWIGYRSVFQLCCDSVCLVMLIGTWTTEALS